MIGMEMKEKVAPHLRTLMDRGVMALAAGVTVLRFLPPLTITQDEVDGGHPGSRGDTMNQEVELLGTGRYRDPSTQERQRAYLVDAMRAATTRLCRHGQSRGIWGGGEREIVLLGHIDTVPGHIPVRQEATIAAAAALMLKVRWRVSVSRGLVAQA